LLFALGRSLREKPFPLLFTGITMNAKENYDEALEYYEKALAIYKQLKDKKWVERLNERIRESRKKADVRDR